MSESCVRINTLNFFNFLLVRNNRFLFFKKKMPQLASPRLSAIPSRPSAPEVTDGNSWNLMSERFIRIRSYSKTTNAL